MYIVFNYCVYDLCRNLSFYDVWEKIKSLSPHWQSFSLSLRLSPDTIESIEANNCNETSETCLRTALTYWLKKITITSGLVILLIESCVYLLVMVGIIKLQLKK